MFYGFISFNFNYIYLKNPMDRGAWWATVLGDTKSCHTYTQIYEVVL